MKSNDRSEGPGVFPVSVSLNTCTTSSLHRLDPPLHLLYHDPKHFFIHDLLHIALPNYTSFLLTGTLLSITSSHTFPFSTSLLSISNPLAIQNIPFRQFFNSVSASSAFSLLANVSFFSQYMSFRLHSLSSSQLYLLPLAHVEITYHKKRWVLFLSTQRQFQSHFLPV